MFGWLNVDKPSGVTSREVVDVVQRIVQPVKVGHAGTLDPLATGVLVLGVGPATRLIRFVQQLPKRYRATFRFGLRSDTEDIQGRVEPCPGPMPERASLEQVCGKFVGTLEQVPPTYSALKVAGRRAYRHARRGESIELEARSVVVYRLELVDYQPPDWTVEVECGKGTYVRSLGRDIAAALGTSAVMTQLRRLAVGSFTVEDAVPVDELTDLRAVEQHLLPAQVAVSHLPQVTVDASQRNALHFGQTIVLESAGTQDQEVAAVDESGQLVAILSPAGNFRWHPSMCFV